MKLASTINVISRNIFFLAAVSVFVVAGCSDDNPTDDGSRSDSKPISVDGIIINPKSPAPGDTVQLTAVVTSTSTNPGDFVQYSWSATGGSFMEDNKIILS